MAVLFKQCLGEVVGRGGARLRRGRLLLLLLLLLPLHEQLPLLEEVISEALDKECLRIFPWLKLLTVSDFGSSIPRGSGLQGGTPHF